MWVKNSTPPSSMLLPPLDALHFMLEIELQHWLGGVGAEKIRLLAYMLVFWTELTLFLALARFE